MSKPIHILSIASLAIVTGVISALPGDGGGSSLVIGPDVIVGSVSDIAKYGTVSGVSAYALGTTSCNIGDQIAWWIDTGADDAHHPVIAQNIYRLKNGRMEQVGMSWVKHGFCALDGSLCGTCNSDPYGCDALGVGCSDPYGASLNGSQSYLGPRSQINANTGVFPYPFSAPAAPATVGRRIQVLMADLDPAQNAGAFYFGEGHYITIDDCNAGTDNNNGSFRRITVGAISSGSYTLSLTGGTYMQKYGIHAWKDHGLGIGIPDPSVTIANADVQGDGRFHVASKVTSLGGGQYRYDYAVHNQNSDRCARSFSVPVNPAVIASELYFHGVTHHSGEPFATTAWSSGQSAVAVGWETQSVTQNANANAIRWGTMFNFSFVCNREPVSGTASIGLFKAGAAGDPVSVSVTVPVPSSPANPADLDGNGVIDGADLGALFANWGGTGASDINADGITDGEDLAVLLGNWTV
ncbi:MAG: hypothetical protein EXS00_05285 [Phycisphaerales bacterium]|nr:hypothetical protein [Phycisphaerales bacterium]